MMNYIEDRCLRINQAQIAHLNICRTGQVKRRWSGSAAAMSRTSEILTTLTPFGLPYPSP